MRSSPWPTTCARAQVGDEVGYVVNRNVNFTNVCVKACRFCAFSRTRRSEEGYFLPIEEIVRRALEAQAFGATEICIQAGLAPGIDARFYVDLVRALKAAAPALHVHAFSPEEVKFAATESGWSFRRVLEEMKDAGLGSLPGTSAEVLDDRVRARIAPGRITTAEWIDVVTTAHAIGLRDHVDDHVRPRRDRPASGCGTSISCARSSARPAASPSSCRSRSCTKRRR